MTTGRKTDVDVVIVGGGAVGATLALELDRLAYRVALVEVRQPDFSSSNPERVIALNVGSRMHFERAGVWQDIAASGSGDIRHIVVAEPGNRGRVDMDAAGASRRLDALGYVLEMGPLLEPIYQKLENSAVQLYFHAAVQAVHFEDARVDVDLLLEGKRKTIRAALLVGADGTNSQIRPMAGIQTRGWDYNRFGIVASVRCEREHAQTAFECFRSAGPLAFLPLADGRYSIVWAVSPGEANQLLGMSDDSFLDALQRAAGEKLLRQTGSIIETSPRAAFPLELTVASSFTRPRLALVGNAAHTVHPVAGQGMNLGLRDVEVLVQELDSELGHRDPGQSIILQAYAEQRRVDTLAVAGFTESMVNSFGSSLPGMKWLRGRGLDVMDSWPALKDLLLSHAAGLSQGNAVSLEAGRAAAEHQKPEVGA
ncbi:MAG TPA: FAD-dependent monooxygenase [Mariprofundaceae bacterium]|nr:FAD-dependent monooxygenase [Mariprofundaceae bacterium]